MGQEFDNLINRLRDSGVSEDLVNEMQRIMTNSKVEAEKYKGLAEKYKKLYEDNESYQQWKESSRIAEARGADHM